MLSCPHVYSDTVHHSYATVGAHRHRSAGWHSPEEGRLYTGAVPPEHTALQPDPAALLWEQCRFTAVLLPGSEAAARSDNWSFVC